MKRVLPAAGAVATILVLGSVLGLISGLPARAEIRALADTNPRTTALMRQRTAEAKSRGRRSRPVQSWVPLSRVSSRLLHAVIASEDQGFFGHEGVDWGAIQESLEKNVERRRLARGGSTITQQLAKNLFFGTRRTLVRKLRELIVARWMEEDLTKPRILALYVNVIEWGDGLYGCEAAARHWYGRSAAVLGREEAAGLAAMVPNPRRINPRVSPRGHERLTRRVLRLMELSGYIGRDVARLGAEPPPEPEDEPLPAFDVESETGGEGGPEASPMAGDEEEPADEDVAGEGGDDDAARGAPSDADPAEDVAPGDEDDSSAEPPLVPPPGTEAGSDEPPAPSPSR